MATITFDTHKFVKELESAGMPSGQAEALVHAQQEILAQALDPTLTTKSGIAEVKAEVAVLKWMMGVLIAIAIASFAKQFF